MSAKVPFACPFLKKGHTIDLASLNSIADSLGALAINLAANGESSAENLLDAALEVLGEGLELHGPCNLDNLVEGDRLVVLDVLLLLAVTRRLLERPDDERRGSGDDRDGGLTVLDGELDGHAETLLYSVQNDNYIVRTNFAILSVFVLYVFSGIKFGGGFPYPVTSSLCDIFTDLLRRETKRTDLGGKGRRGTNLTTGRPEGAIE